MLPFFPSYDDFLGFATISLFYTVVVFKNSDKISQKSPDFRYFLLICINWVIGCSKPKTQSQLAKTPQLPNSQYPINW